MADRRSRPAVLLALAAAVVLLAVVPAAVSAAPGQPAPVDRIAIADAPPGAGEDCVEDPDAHPGVGLQKCPTPFSIATLLPFVGLGVVVLLAIGVGWYLVMRRRASRPFLPDEPVGATAAGPERASVAGGAASGDWWTCRNCGSTNMVGSARCYKCGAWPR